MRSLASGHAIYGHTRKMLTKPNLLEAATARGTATCKPRHSLRGHTSSWPLRALRRGRPSAARCGPVLKMSTGPVDIRIRVSLRDETVLGRAQTALGEQLRDQTLEAESREPALGKRITRPGYRLHGHQYLEVATRAYGDEPPQLLPSRATARHDTYRMPIPPGCDIARGACLRKRLPQA